MFWHSILAKREAVASQSSTILQYSDDLNSFKKSSWQVSVWLFESFTFLWSDKKAAFSIPTVSRITMPTCNYKKMKIFFITFSWTGAVVCRCSSKKVFLKIPKIFIGKHQVADLKTCNFIKKRLQHRCSPVKFAKFLRTSFLTELLRCLRGTNRGVFRTLPNLCEGACLQKQLTATSPLQMFDRVSNTSLHKESLRLHPPSTLNFSIFLLYWRKWRSPLPPERFSFVYMVKDELHHTCT